jgi:hypothetical protein
MKEKSNHTVTGSSKSTAPVHRRVVVSREDAAIRVEKTELTGALKRSLTTNVDSFGVRRGPGK